MTSLDEFIQHANTDKTQVNDAASSIERTKYLIEQVQSRFELLAADTMTAGAQQLRSLTEDAIALLAPVAAKLDDAVAEAEFVKT